MLNLCHDLGTFLRFMSHFHLRSTFQTWLRRLAIDHKEMHGVSGLDPLTREEARCYWSRGPGDQLAGLLLGDLVTNRRFPLGNPYQPRPPLTKGGLSPALEEKSPRTRNLCLPLLFEFSPHMKCWSTLGNFADLEAVKWWPVGLKLARSNPGMPIHVHATFVYPFPQNLKALTPTLAVRHTFGFPMAFLWLLCWFFLKGLWKIRDAYFSEITP